MAQKLQIVSEQNVIPRCTLDGPSGGTCKVEAKILNGEASAYGEKKESILELGLLPVVGTVINTG